MKNFFKVALIFTVLFLFSASIWAQPAKKTAATFKNTGGSGIYQLFFYTDQSGKIYFVEEGQEYKGAFTYVLDSGNFDNGIVVLTTDGKSYSIDIENGRCTVDGVAMKRQ